jgi:hypothetical protein
LIYLETYFYKNINQDLKSRRIKMKKSSNLFRDIVTGVFFTVGIFGFMSGAFVWSTLLFGAASVASNLDSVFVSKQSA